MRKGPPEGTRRQPQNALFGTLSAVTESSRPHWFIKWFPGGHRELPGCILGPPGSILGPFFPLLHVVLLSYMFFHYFSVSSGVARWMQNSCLCSRTCFSNRFVCPVAALLRPYSVFQYFWPSSLSRPMFWYYVRNVRVREFVVFCPLTLLDFTPSQQQHQPQPLIDSSRRPRKKSGTCYGTSDVQEIWYMLRYFRPRKHLVHVTVLPT